MTSPPPLTLTEMSALDRHPFTLTVKERRRDTLGVKYCTALYIFVTLMIVKMIIISKSDLNL